MPTNIAFLGSKKIAYLCLQHILLEQHLLNAKVVAVVSNPTFKDTKYDIIPLAQQHEIPIFLDHTNLPIVDILISVQYHKILKAQHISPQKVLQIAVNLHMAPLPEYRGCNQFSWAIVDEKTIFGTTLHQLTTGIDSGAILFEKRFTIPPNVWVKELYSLTEQHSIQLFKESLPQLLNADYTLKPQEDFMPMRTCAYHYRKDINSLKKIDLSWSAKRIEKHIRATYFPPFEPPYSIIDGKKFYFTPNYVSKTN